MIEGTTVFVVDDDQAMRDSLRFLITSDGLAVECFASAEEFLDSYTPGRPGCLVLDVRMPKLSGLELQEKLREDRFAPPVVLITGHGDVPMAVRALKAGAFDFIEKPFNDAFLLERVREALEHEHKQREDLEHTLEVERRADTLTTRETEVFEIVVQGKPNKVIARELGLSQKTVEVHRAHVMEKMKAKSFADLVKMAMRIGRAGDTPGA